MDLLNSSLSSLQQQNVQPNMNISEMERQNRQQEEEKKMSNDEI
jgi:hypothetical protein